MRLPGGWVRGAPLTRPCDDDAVVQLRDRGTWGKLVNRVNQAVAPAKHVNTDSFRDLARIFGKDSPHLTMCCSSGRCIRICPQPHSIGNCNTACTCHNNGETQSGSLHALTPDALQVLWIIDWIFLAEQGCPECLALPREIEVARYYPASTSTC